MRAAKMTQEAGDYYWCMAGRGRLIYGSDPCTILCTFFVLPDLELIGRYYDRPCWTTPPDLPDGPIVYLDKLIATQMDSCLAHAIEDVITERVPSWQQAVWYRPGRDADRRYTCLRKGVRYGANV